METFVELISECMCNRLGSGVLIDTSAQAMHTNNQNTTSLLLLLPIIQGFTLMNIYNISLTIINQFQLPYVITK